jgi:hypothetical protein
MAESETVALVVTWVGCGRRPLPGERWSLRFAVGEVALYCPECDEREFGHGDEWRYLPEALSAAMTGGEPAGDSGSNVPGDTAEAKLGCGVRKLCSHRGIAPICRRNGVLTTRADEAEKLRA